MPTPSAPDPVPSPGGTYELFISYARKDDRPQKPDDARGWVTALRDEILADHRRFSTEPLRIFFDSSDIADMDDWRHRILEGLRQSRILLVCLSPNYYRSEYCRWEFEEYVQRQVHQLTGQDSFAQVYFTEVPGVSEQDSARDWYELLRRTNYTDLRPWFPRGIEALHEEIVKRRLASLGTSLWERIQRARRATRVPGNLRRMNPHFVGRRAELRKLHESLALGAIGVVAAINGLGGQGKTELATAYAHGWADSYPAGLWMLGAEGKKELLPLFGELCADLSLPLSAGAGESADQRGRRALAELKRRALAAASRDPDKGAACFILLDNVSEPVLLAEPQLAQLPREDWLRVVATTRDGPEKFPAARQSSLAFISVDALAEDDASRLIEEHQPDAQWPAATVVADSTAAREIVRELGGFTLAVESVAIYLGLHPDIHPADYLARLRTEGLPSVDALPVDAEVAAQMQHREKQFSLVMEQTLARLSPPERTALDFAALLPPDGIPWPWLQALVTTQHADALANRPGYPDPWPALRRRLQGLRLLTPVDNPDVARMHRLVKAEVRSRSTTLKNEAHMHALNALLRWLMRAELTPYDYDRLGITIDVREWSEAIFETIVSGVFLRVVNGIESSETEEWLCGIFLSSAPLDEPPGDISMREFVLSRELIRCKRLNDNLPFCLQSYLALATLYWSYGLNGSHVNRFGFGKIDDIFVSLFEFLRCHRSAKFWTGFAAWAAEIVAVAERTRVHASKDWATEFRALVASLEG